MDLWYSRQSSRARLVGRRLMLALNARHPLRLLIAPRALFWWTTSCKKVTTATIRLSIPACSYQKTRSVLDSAERLVAATPCSAQDAMSEQTCDLPRLSVPSSKAYDLDGTLNRGCYIKTQTFTLAMLEGRHGSMYSSRSLYVAHSGLLSSTPTTTRLW